MKNNKKILIVDDEVSLANTIQEALEIKGYSCIAVNNAEDAYTALSKNNISVALIDLKLPDENGMSVITKIKKFSPEIEIIVITGHATIETAVVAMEHGAFTYLRKPINLSELREIVKRAFEKVTLKLSNIKLQKALSEQKNIDMIIGEHPKMQVVFDKIHQIAPTSASVLITGESGTGKELVAQSIHNKSDRKNKPFITVNCAALAPNLVESELFGHKKGAFTGAVNDYKGKFLLADKGTLFLDEISEINTETQAKLLRAIETSVVEPLGSEKSYQADVRLITATNRDLTKQIEDNKFRQDLYFRIKVLIINLPPLRERKSDIPLLFEHFIQLFSKKHNRLIDKIDKQVYEILYDYKWPGNVRELRNLVETLVITSYDAKITVDTLPDDIKFSKGDTKSLIQTEEVYNIEDIEKQLIKNALKQYSNKIKAAEKLGISKRTLYRKIKKYGIINI